MTEPQTLADTADTTPRQPERPSAIAARLTATGAHCYPAGDHVWVRFPAAEAAELANIYEDHAATHATH